MHHVRLSSRGDPLCPLGFHPQVRWPLRCKRCFRDFTEHGNRDNRDEVQLRRNELTVSTPALSSSSSSRNREESRIPSSSLGSRNWTSSSNLSSTGDSSRIEDPLSMPSTSRNTNSSWASSPNLAEDDAMDDVSVSFTLPRRRPKPPDTGQDETDDARRTQYTVRRRSSSGLSNNYSNEPIETNTSNAPSTSYRTRSQLIEERPRDMNVLVKLPPKKPSPSSTANKGKTLAISTEDTSSDEDVSHVQTYSGSSRIQENDSNYKYQVQQLKKELEAMKTRCEKAEREKSDYMLRRLDAATARSSSSEMLKLQQKVNELRNTTDELQIDKKSLLQKIRDMEYEMDSIKSSAAKREADILRDKLQTAEQLCEDLVEENEEMKKELKDMEEEMNEIQDKFMEDRADEYTMLKKELELANKNCRVLTFKLKKDDKRIEQLEKERKMFEEQCLEIAGGQTGLDNAERIKQLEHDLNVANETASRLQKELEEATRNVMMNGKEKGTVAKKKAPKLGNMGKTPSTEKMSRESLTRGDSQEDPVQLLRDLQDSLEREADLREQLRYAEEQAENLRKKSARVEDDNESLAMQLKKMAVKARTHRHSPSHQRLTPEPITEKDEGISDEEDPSELRILLELNEQEASVLRRKVEELDTEGDQLKRKVKELQEKLNAKTSETSKRSVIRMAEPMQSNGVYEQKMKVLEKEMSELRMKLIEKERECERLHAELTIAPKKGKTIQKSRSLDGDQQTVDLKRQLQVVETEANILRTKTQNLEAENDRLLSENNKLSLIAATKNRSNSVERTQNDSKLTSLEKLLEESNKKIKELESEKKTPSVAEIEKLKNQFKKVENEKNKYEEALLRLKENALSEAVKFYKLRKPKIPTDLTTKLQLKKMVNDLESEIGEILVILKKADDNKKQAPENQSSNNDSLKGELEETKINLDNLIKETKEKSKKKDIEIERLNIMIQGLESDKLKALRERDASKTKYEKEIEKMKDTKTDLENQKRDGKQEIEKLKADIKANAVLEDKLQEYRKQIDSLSKDLEKERNLSVDLKAKVDFLNKGSLESLKLQKERPPQINIQLLYNRPINIGEGKNKVSHLEAKLVEVEEKLRRSEKLATSKKDKLQKLEKEFTELNKKYTTLEKNHDSLSVAKYEVDTKLGITESKLIKLNDDLEAKTSEIKKLEAESRMKEKNQKSSDANDMHSQALTSANRSIKELTTKLEKAEKVIKEKEDELAKKEKELNKEIEGWERKASDLEMDYHANRKLLERLKATHEKEIRAKEAEIAQIKSSVLGEEPIKAVKEDLKAKIESLETALESEKHEYDELTKRYEELEEEHVVMKATLVQEKEKIQSQLVKAANEMEEVENELRFLKESYSIKQEFWAKEKHRLEDKSKDCDTLILEKSRLQAISDEKQSQIEQLRKEADSLSEQASHMRKDNEELRRKMEDYQKLDRIQRNVSGDINSLQEELKEYKSRLALEEKSKKKELTSLKMRYDNRMSIITDELVNIQAQMGRYKKERDSYKHLLEAARRNIADLKASGSSIKYSIDETEWRSQITALEQQIASLEDDLSEAKSQSSKLKTELISERSQWEVKHSELISRLNELEEERILNTGRTKVSGTKTRMELAWHKEREEQQRLLHETSTLARDMRQTLFEVERERDRERLEAKRKLDQLKKSNEEEQEEIRKKLNEMQCDLLELRDAHAKLRTTNEKLRREKDKLDRERERLKQTITIKNNMEKEEERQIINVAQLVEELTVLAPDLFPSKPRPPIMMPTPPARRKGPKSREASPMLERKDYSRESSIGRDDAKSHEVQEILRRLTEAASQLKKVQQEDKVVLKKAFGSYRSSSIESDASDVSSVLRRNLQRKPSLLRKSLSLDQTTAEEQQVWQTDNDQEGSMTSVQSFEESEKNRQNMYRRENSLDSRLSGGSTQSEIIPSDKKKKLGLFGKLKKLTKSRSIDQDSDIGSTSQLDPGSDASLNTGDERVGGKQFKDKITGIFKKSGSTSRGNSQERSLKPPPTPKTRDSTQRPLVSSATLSAAGDFTTSSRVQQPPNTAPVQRKVKK